MYKKDARFHYGIKKHICGDGYMYDCWVLGPNCLPLIFIYKASANYMCEQLQKNNTKCKFYVVRYD